MKIICLFFLLITTISAHAENCASSIAGLRDLSAHPTLPLLWKENKIPLTMKIGQSNDQLKIVVDRPQGNWAVMTARICKVGDYYEARITSLKWGPATPLFVRMLKPKTLKLDLVYHTKLDVSALGYTLHFNAI